MLGSRLVEGEVTWASPSNIALVKYWGKKPIQIPKNPSISFTLNNAITKTKVKYQSKEVTDKNIAFEIYFEGNKKESFKPKINQFFHRIIEVFPFLSELKLEIHTTNTFPHSAGIASSASGMSALALCLCSLERELFDQSPSKQDFLQKASYIARLGSGSACRSLYPKLAAWGKSESIKNSNDLYAVNVDGVDPIFETFHDDILIISGDEKEVSSTVGHGLMDNNIFSERRFQQARENMVDLLTVMKRGDLERFGEIVEQEALTLHALMMTSNPPFILMHPNSIIAINKVKAFRKDTALPLYFTLDAGPNLHILYPHSIETKAKSFIQEELIQLCDKGRLLEDKVGNGPYMHK